jgi:hypothetical protein
VYTVGLASHMYYLRSGRLGLGYGSLGVVKDTISLGNTSSIQRDVVQQHDQMHSIIAITPWFHI